MINIEADRILVDGEVAVRTEAGCVRLCPGLLTPTQAELVAEWMLQKVRRMCAPMVDASFPRSFYLKKTGQPLAYVDGSGGFRLQAAELQLSCADASEFGKWLVCWAETARKD